MPRIALVAGVGFLVWLLPAPVGASLVARAPSVSTELVGTFAITGGSCAGPVQGSYFRMMTAGGASFIENGDSPCADKTYSPLLPGSDGGLVTGTYQPAPSSRFDGAGGGTATLITRPMPFFGVPVATSTEPVDPQTGTKVPSPLITADDAGNLTGTTAAFGAAWNREDFNQGSPKPDGSRPGATSGPSGAYDSATGAFTLEWTSLSVGGPFNSFTGVWHLEGTFHAQGGTPAPAPAPAADPVAPLGSTGATPEAAVTGAGGATSTVPDLAGAAAPASTGTPAVETAAPAAPSDGRAGLAGTTTLIPVPSDGWRPATWLVVLTALLGVGAVVALVLLSRPGVRAGP